MELHNLRPASGSVKNNKRKGRGEGSGMGGTSTRGHKGAKSRAGYSSKRHFEGGQMPLQMRLPKRGFKNINRVSFVAMNISRLQEIAEKYDLTTVGVTELLELGIVGKADKVKVLAGGELLLPLTISAHACSEAARVAIEAKGGTLTLI